MASRNRRTDEETRLAHVALFALLLELVGGVEGRPVTILDQSLCLRLRQVDSVIEVSDPKHKVVALQRAALQQMYRYEEKEMEASDTGRKLRQ